MESATNGLGSGKTSAFGLRQSEPGEPENGVRAGKPENGNRKMEQENGVKQGRSKRPIKKGRSKRVMPIKKLTWDGQEGAEALSDPHEPH